MDSTYDRKYSLGDRWEFRKSVDGEWWWRTVSSIAEETRRSVSTFPDMTECIADAQRHGYVGT